MSKKNKTKKIEKSNEKGFNFKTGELYNRLNYLNQISTYMSDKKILGLSSLYIIHLKKIKERNCLKLSKDFNNKICKYCNSYFSSYPSSKLEVGKVNSRLGLFVECGGCLRVSKINIHDDYII